MKKNIIRLTESELRSMIKEAVTKIIKESSYNSYDVEVDMYYIVDYCTPQLDDFFEEADCPETVSVELVYEIEPYDAGDYYTPPSGGDANIYDYRIDTDGKFKSILPPELYDSFIKSVESYLDNNLDEYREKIYDDYDDDEPDYEDYYD